MTIFFLQEHSQDEMFCDLWRCVFQVGCVFQAFPIFSGISVITSNDYTRGFLLAGRVSFENYGVERERKTGETRKKKQQQQQQQRYGVILT